MGLVATVVSQIGPWPSRVLFFYDGPAEFWLYYDDHHLGPVWYDSEGLLHCSYCIVLEPEPGARNSSGLYEQYPCYSEGEKVGRKNSSVTTVLLHQTCSTPATV